jgi:hypothetical protein
MPVERERTGSGKPMQEVVCTRGRAEGGARRVGFETLSVSASCGGRHLKAAMEDAERRQQQPEDVKTISFKAL